LTIVAIDQGTTSTKSFAWTGEGLREGRRLHHRQIRPKQGWVEHDPEELVQNVRVLIDAEDDLQGVGLANQGETVVAWDALSKRPLYNALVWQDERTSNQIEELRRSGVEELTLQRAGLPLDAYFSATKLRWLLDNADGARDLLRSGRLRLGTSDAFFLDRLTGVFATDPSTASRTSLMNIQSLEWDEALCDAFGVPRECLPEIRPTTGEFGVLDQGVPVVCSIVDQQASLFGHNCHSPGDIKLTFGTGAFVLGLTEGPALQAASKGLLPTCAWAKKGERARYALDGGVLSAGAAVEWLGQVGLSNPDEGFECSSAPAIERGLVFVPALAGLGSPIWDRSARGAWFGLDLATQRSDLYQAVLEGIALRASQIVDAMSVALDGVSRIAVDGGLTKNPYFVQFLANALGRPLDVADTAEVTAIGVLRFCIDALSASSPERLLRHSLVVPGAPLQTEHHRRFSNAVSLVRGFGRPDR
jgi:glycerol kinase